jgi:hypothetical protein
MLPRYYTEKADNSKKHILVDYITLKYNHDINTNFDFQKQEASFFLILVTKTA